MFHRVHAFLDWLDEQRWIRVTIAAAGCLAIFGFLAFSGVDPRIQAVFAVVVALLTFFYRRKSSQPLPKRKPWFAWFPKYTVPCSLSDAVLNSPDPQTALTERLSEMGFTCDRQTPKDLHFTRGYAKADFSIEIIKLNVVFPLPITAETEFRIELGWSGGFDTGDLWLFANKLKECLEQDQVVGDDKSRETKAA